MKTHKIFFVNFRVSSSAVRATRVKFISIYLNVEILNVALAGLLISRILSRKQTLDFLIIGESKRDNSLSKYFK